MKNLWKDTAPGRRAHTPPLWRSPQDMRAFPAVLHTESGPQSGSRCCPDEMMYCDPRHDHNSTKWLLLLMNFYKLYLCSTRLTCVKYFPLGCKTLIDRSRIRRRNSHVVSRNGFRDRLNNIYASPQTLKICTQTFFWLRRYWDCSEVINYVIKHLSFLDIVLQHRDAVLY